VFDEATLGELAVSIRRHGVLQPILVEYCEDGDYYRIISGERRYRAAGMAELSVIPCLVRVVEEGDRLAQQLVENIQREDLSPVDKARGLLELRARLGAEGTWGHIEALTGLSERRRKQFVALLRLPEDIQRDIVSTGAGRSERQITEKHARALLRLGDYPDEQRRLYDLIRTSEEPISGDRAFELAGEALHGHDGVTRRLVITYRSVSELIEALEERLAALRDVSR
jgi:ParB family chromosome partitioning protein